MYDKGIFSDLTQTGYFLTEALRKDPSVPFSFSFTFTKNAEVGQYKIPANTICFIDIHYTLHNPKEWHEPEEFIPERFDPGSTYFKTP